MLTAKVTNIIFYYYIDFKEMHTVYRVKHIMNKIIQVIRGGSRVERFTEDINIKTFVDNITALIRKVFCSLEFHANNTGLHVFFFTFFLLFLSLKNNQYHYHSYRPLREHT